MWDEKKIFLKDYDQRKNCYSIFQNKEEEIVMIIITQEDFYEMLLWSVKNKHGLRWTILWNFTKIMLCKINIAAFKHYCHKTAKKYDPIDIQCLSYYINWLCSYRVQKYRYILLLDVRKNTRVS